MEFNLLPLEVCLQIFSYLPNRQVMRIRLVCKQWNDLINSEFKFKQLQCHRFGAGLYYDRAREYDFCFASAIPFLQYVCNDRKFRRIEYLIADLEPSVVEMKDAFEFLNSLTFLQKARFNCSYYGSDEVQMNRVVVNLDRLEKFDFYFYTYPQVSVLLNLPSLHYLALSSFKGLTIGHPEKLRTLVMGCFTWEGVDYYSKFTGLTKIYGDRGEVTRISTSFIKRLPSLREIHLKHYERFDEFRPVCLDVEEPCLPAPSGQKKVRIFYCGIEVSLEQIRSEGDQWDSFFWEYDEGNAQFITRNLQSSVDNNPEIIGIHYNTIADELNDIEMFGVIPQKFPKIRDLAIYGNVADQNRLLKFVDQFKAKRLFFEGGTGLPRSFFFDKFAKNRPFIRELSIFKESSMDILSGDLDFVFKFENLETICLYYFQLPLNFVGRLLKELKSISYIRFCVFQRHLEPHERIEPYEFQVWQAEGLELTAGYSYFKASGNWKTNSLEHVNELNRRLKVDGYVCLQKLLAMLRDLEWEEQESLLMMRNYVYEQRYWIDLPKELIVSA